MRIDTMRRLDRWLGVPACWVLTLLRRMERTARNGGVPRRIAIVKLAEQGATVLAAPAIRRAIELVGADNVFFVVFEENRPVLDLMGLIPERNVIAIRTSGVFRFVVDVARAVLRMRRMGIDAAVDFEFFARASAVLCFLGGAKIRVGYHGGGGPYRGDLMTHRLSYNPHLHASEVFRTQVEAVTADPRQLPALECDCRHMVSDIPAYTPPPEDTARMSRALRDLLRKEVVSPLILFNANCSDLLPLRKWPEARYVELSRFLLGRYPDLNIAFTGAPSEAEPVNRLVQLVGSPRCVSMAGRTTFRELLALYQLAEVLVTNDSGPAHFASLTWIDVVVLFGPETPAAFGVRSPRSHILWSGLACSPCVNAYNNRYSACRDNLCMQRITVEEVRETVCRAYEARLAQRSTQRHAV